MSKVPKATSQHLIEQYRENRASKNRETVMPKLKLKDQRPDYVLDREAMSKRMWSAVEQCEDYGTTEIAEFCECDRSLVYEWCRVGGSRPGMDNLTNFCKATGADWEWIMFGVEPDQFLEPMDTTDLLEFKDQKAFRQNVKKAEGGVPGHHITERQGGYVTLFIPSIEPNELGQDEILDVSLLETQIEKWIADPTLRKGMSLPLFENELETIGIPRFCAPVVSLDFGPDHNQGAMLGFATDIVPMNGDFALVAVKKHNWEFWRHSAGFFYSVDSRLTTNNMAADFYENHECVIRTSKSKTSHDDISINKDNGDQLKLLAVATYKTEWLSTMLKEKFTSLSDRRADAWAKRARIPENES